MKNKKITLSIIISAIMILLFGTTFAYFSLSKINNTSAINFSGHIEKKGDVTLSNWNVSNFRLDFDTIDMSKGNEGYYYASSTEEKPYVLSESEGTYKFAKLEVNSGADDTDYYCTVDVNVKADGTMRTALESGDFLVTINGGSLNTRLDLYKIKNTGKETYKVMFNLHGNDTKYIETYLRLKNKSTDQNYLKNTNMNIGIEASNLNCEIVDKKYMDITSEDKDLRTILGDKVSKIKTVQFVRYLDEEINEETITPTSNIPYIYDISEKGDKSVLAWLKVNNEDNTMYDLYIGSKNRIYTKNLNSAFMNFTNMESITFDNLDTSEVTSMNSMFSGDSKLKAIDVSTFDTSNVTGTTSMFSGCSSLTNIMAINKWNMNKVTGISSMFNRVGLSEIDLSGWDLSSLTSGFGSFISGNNLTNIVMTDIKIITTNSFDGFTNSNNIELIDLSNWDASKVTDRLAFNRMIPSNITKDVSLKMTNWDVANLTALSGSFSGLAFKDMDLSGWNTEKVNNLASTFSSNSKLVNLNLSGWNTLNVTYMMGIFQNDNLLQNINLDRWTAPNVTDMQSMFNGCSSLAELDLDDWDVHSVTNLNNMFAGCSSLVKISMNNWNLESVYSINIFNGNNNLQVIEMANWKIPKVSNLSLFLKGFNNLRIVDMKKLDAPELTSILGMFRDCPKLEQAEINGWNAPKLFSFSSLFNNCPSLTFVDLSEWTLNAVSNDAVEMFRNCTNLQKINMDGWVIKNGSLSLNNAFSNCPNLEEINMSNWTISNRVYLTSAFSYNSKLKRINMNNWNIESLTTLNSFLNFQIDSSEAELFVKNWNTPNVTDMSFLFNTNHFKSIDARDWNTPVLENVSNLFSISRYIKYINMSNWDTSHVTDMSSMFDECPYLETLELNGLKSSNVTDFSYMFRNTPNLKQIDLSEAEFTKAKSFTDMFKNSNQNILIEAQDETNATWIEERLKEVGITGARVTRRIR